MSESNELIEAFERTDLPASPKISVVGLGPVDTEVVGLPLAVALSQHLSVTGVDVDSERIEELTRGHDRTMEVDIASMQSAAVEFSADPASMVHSDVLIVTVPTPVDEQKRPNLSAVLAASRTRRQGAFSR